MVLVVSRECIVGIIYILSKCPDYWGKILVSSKWIGIKEFISVELRNNLDYWYKMHWK